MFKLDLSSGIALRGVAALTGAIVIALSSTLTWASAQVGNHAISGTLLDIPAAPVLFAAGVLAIGAGGVAAISGRPRGLDVAAIAAVSLALLTLGFVVFAESIATLIPGSGSVVSLRRVTLGAGVGAGAWIALLAAVGVLVASQQSINDRVAESAVLLRNDGPLVIAAFALLVTVLVAVVQLRQEAWIGASPFGVTLEISGVGIPGVSPATYVAVWALAGAIALIGIGLFEYGALLAAAAGWMVSAAAGVTIAAAATVANTPVAGAHATGATWLALFSGLAIAASAGTLLLRGGERA